MFSIDEILEKGNSSGRLTTAISALGVPFHFRKTFQNLNERCLGPFKKILNHSIIWLALIQKETSSRPQKGQSIACLVLLLLMRSITIVVREDKVARISFGSADWPVELFEAICSLLFIQFDALGSQRIRRRQQHLHSLNSASKFPPAGILLSR